MDDLKTKVERYIDESLLSLDNLSSNVFLQESLSEEISSHLLSKKYRKYSISNDVKINISKKIKNIVENSLPMIFIPSFGGYKHWWCPTYPAVDWAEVFNMKFLLNYLSPVYNSYLNNKVIIEYESEEVIVSEMNNVPQAGLDEYTRTFRCLADYFTTRLNGKTKISLTLARDLYDVNKLHKIISDTYKEHERIFNSYPVDEQEKRLRKVKTNFLLKGVNDYSLLNDADLTEIYKHSRVLNETFLDADFELRPNYFEGESSLPILFSFGLGPGGENWLHVGSCSSSMVDFWAGIGILEYYKDKFEQRIISRSQFSEIKGELKKIAVDTALKGICDNFSYIYVYEGKLKF